ncbi:hypothetical protein DAETH_48490 (plasmid) [Deinococcus aetherius]|uniref:Uncharacterized protein n=1 Tax=Deinococcus aetherius TaxID=200252 RepID=A0ABN6RPT2_9DEIO|nr:hypothetical protein [Deinococcus aetherius]BDP44880.1 hypothetical protein DAETH_48490 [Deinococcus aetherius]
MPGMTAREQEAFAAYLRGRLPGPLHLFALTTYAAQVLGRPRLLHWRGLTSQEARVVMAAAKRDYPASRPQAPLEGEGA